MNLSDEKCIQIDFCLMLNGHNLNKFRQDICSHHNHLWYARVTYLLGRPQAISVLEYFDPNYKKCDCIECKKK